MLISHKIQNLNLQDNVVKILCEMDTKLSSISRKKLDNDRFGGSVCIDMDNSKLLARYKQILIDKASNRPCLCSFSFDDIISRIKQLLNEK